MELVFIVGAVQAFFLTILIINKKNKSKGDFVMATLLVFMGVLLIGYTLEVRGLDTDYPIFLGFYTAMPTLMGPLFYLYILSYTNRSQKFNPLYLVHGLPYVLFTLAVFLKLTIYSEGSIVEDRFIIEEGKEPVFFVMSLFRVFFGTLYLVAGIIILNKHTSRINKYFSYTENVDLKWLRYVIIMMIVLWTTVIIVNVLYHFGDLLPYRLGDNIIFVVLTVVVFLNGYYGIKQQIIFSPSVESSEKSKNTIETREVKKQYANSGLTIEESQKHLQRLLSFMENEQPFLNGKLSLKEVAEYLDLSPNHLSQVINENLEKNFFDFVNGYRIALIKQKMLDSNNSNLTLLGMAYDSGFNSKSSFNNIFKKQTGFTPSQYLQSQSA